MGSIVLGKLALRWCGECNLPTLGKACSACNSKTVAVKHTPPGDVRPAFAKDLDAFRALVDRQFGDGCGERLIPKENVVILNGIPDQDRMEEVIVSGLVVGNYRYTIEHGYRFLLKPVGALRILPSLSRSWVKVDNDAVKFIIKGTSVLAPGVVDADPTIAPGDEVVVLSEGGEFIGPGTAKLTGSEMKGSNYGLSVRLRQKWKALSLPENYERSGSWEVAVRASMRTLENYQTEAASFVRTVVRDHSGLPVMVSLSGGKDSLVVLLLVLEAGFEPTLLFLDTGLEFPETVENVKLTAREYDLPLVVADAGNAFWKNVARFGPPAKDFRWCCKVCKLGPTARTIMETYPDGVLSFIGQRAYESSQRARKPKVWENPWVPGQVGASPIQHWTALHIWLYLFWKKAEYNPLYELGFARIGCWLCPASDQADYLDILEVHPESERWREFLKAYAREKGYTDEWLNYGLWRWKKPPGFVKDLMERKGIRFRESRIEQKGVGKWRGGNGGAVGAVGAVEDVGDGEQGAGGEAIGQGREKGEREEKGVGQETGEEKEGVERQAGMERGQEALTGVERQAGIERGKEAVSGVERQAGMERGKEALTEVEKQGGMERGQEALTEIEGEGGEGETEEDREEEENPQLSFLMGDIRPSCTDELTVEGIFDRPLDIERTSRLLNIFGLTCYDGDTRVASIGKTVTLTSEGSLTINAPRKKDLEKHLETCLEIIIRSEECVGCGICLARCPNSALFLDDRRVIDILVEKCAHCRKCLGKCPVTDFREDREFES